MRRRRLVAVMALLAGCPGRLPEALGPSGRTDGGTVPPPETAATATEASESAAVDAESTGVPDARTVEQFLRTGSVRGRDQYLTVVVERGDRVPFVDSFPLFPGEQRVSRLQLVPGVDYRVIAETREGDRETFDWRVTPALDGAELTLADDLSFWRSVRCGPDCAVAGGGDAPDVPLVGDGSTRWYDAAGVVLQNPREAAVEATLSVELSGEAVLEYAYRLPPRAQVEVPLTFRSGRYDVRVDVAGHSVAADWRVPEQPQQYVTLGDPPRLWCGPATTVLDLVNLDDRTSRLDVAVSRDGERLFDGRYELGPDERRRVQPVAESGRYEVRMALRDGPARTATWWSCPPRGPASVVVDATGGVTLQAVRPR